MESEQIIAAASVVISGAALYVAWRTVHLQHKHNALSVRPVPNVAAVDFENKQRVKLFNNGPGPLFVTQVRVSDGDATKDTIIEWMPDLQHPLAWSNFTGKLINRSIPSGGELTLLELQGDTKDARYCEARDDCRRKLSKLTVSIDFTDVYGTKFEQYDKPLSWFGRNVQTAV